MLVLVSTKEEEVKISKIFPRSLWMTPNIIFCSLFKKPPNFSFVIIKEENHFLINDLGTPNHTYGWTLKIQVQVQVRYQSNESDRFIRMNVLLSLELIIRQREITEKYTYGARKCLKWKLNSSSAPPHSKWYSKNFKNRGFFIIIQFSICCMK